MKDDKGGLFADCHSILVRWRNYFSQLFIAHEVNKVRQTAIHTPEPLWPESNDLEFGLAIEKLNRHKLSS